MLRILFTLTLVLLFLPAFAFPLGERAFRIYFLALLPFFGLYITLNFKKFIGKSVFLYKNTPYKYLIYFLAYLFISSFILLFLKPADGKHSIIYLLQLSILYILPSYLLSAYFISNEERLKKYLKFYFAALFCVFVFGLIEFIFGKILHIEFINAIQRFLANERNFVYFNTERYAGRLASVFAEPGWLGGFLFLNFPVIYACAKSKYKIFENNYINNLIKKSVIPLAWLNLLFTISPIWLIFCSLQALFIFRKEIIKLIFNIKTWIILSVIFGSGAIFILLFLVITDKKIEIGQIERIINTVTNLLNFYAFINAEQSLGSRIVSYVIQIKMFFEHWLIGVGINNMSYYAPSIVEKYKIPMTIENYFNYNNALRNGQMSINSSILYALLSETGIIGLFFYYLFIFKSYNFMKKCISKMPDCLFKDFSTGLSVSIFLYIFMTFYDTLLTVPYNWFFMGLAVSIFYIGLEMKSKEKLNEENMD